MPLVFLIAKLFDFVLMVVAESVSSNFLFYFMNFWFAVHSHGYSRTTPIMVHKFSKCFSRFNF
ncbi:hypothetical protein RchiOBHm_Chr7g0193491 [Rosa chinensis]|uniref:Uncharacterized protein n=1 Tax=Rosa chinensis TaxID=74649 RepID=A0A2P6P5X1_ROSCH|nr:hypothetical protein RchiOBHm_Chr7g0193491 [Rosa chinensis]